MKNVSIQLPEALVSPLLKVCKQLNDRLSCAGSNDFEIPDSPENRELLDIFEARNLRLSVAELKSHKDYREPHEHNGMLYTEDFAVFGYLVAQLQEAAALIRK